MKILRLSMAALAVCAGASLASAGLLDVTSVEPAAGIQQEVGTPLLNFTAVPTPNPACSELALIYRDGEVISTIATYESNRLQRFVFQPDESIRLVFTTKKYTDPGEYRVVVPEGFVTFNDGADVNAAYEVKYTILDGSNVTWAPAGGGYYLTAPSTLSLEIPGVSEIIDNEMKFDHDLNRGGIAYFLSQSILVVGESTGITQTIEGNKLTWTVSGSSMNVPGYYEMVLAQGALTLVYPDGSKMSSPEYRVGYYVPNMPIPELSLLEGKDNNELYEIGDFSISYPAGIKFMQFMRNPSLYSVKDNGVRGDRLTSYSLATTTVKGSQTLDFTATSLYTTPGDYMLIVGKSSFSAEGPFYNKEYYGGDDSDDEYTDPFAGHDEGDIITAWNAVDFIYRLRIIPSPAEIASNGNITISEISEIPIYFPNAEMIAFPLTAPDEKPCVRDRFWREVKGYTVSLEILKATAGEVDPQNARLTSASLSEGCVAKAVITPALTASKVTNYDIQIPKGSFVCDGEDSRELIQRVVIDPSVTAVKAPEVAPAEGEPSATVTVVNSNGVTILKDAAPSELFNLPAGLYIINGRATMLK